MQRSVDRVWVLYITMAINGACQLDALVPENVAISCSGPDDCPTGYACASGRCFEGRTYTPACGNGIVDDDEVCDDENTVSGDGCRSDCQSDESCGNGLVDSEVGEACDDGNSRSGDGCQTNCALPSCGDGTVDANELCDDGNNVFGDGCNARCTSDETCGNGIVDVNVVGESCDDGNSVAGDGCDNDCNIERCGDGILALGEACDDGNNVSGDGCSGNCNSIEICGNGFLDVDESCDDGNDAGGDGCSPTCQVESCGNGVRDPGEVCDDGNNVSGDGCSGGCDSIEICGNGVLDLGESCDDGGRVPGDGCSSSCVVERCGNKVLDPGEICDDGNGASGDGCSADCRSDESCGNGYVDVVAGETCDQGAANSNEPNATCRNHCQLRNCGDSILDDASGEACDTNQMGGNTCASLGFYHGGTLTCSRVCTLDPSECLGFCGDGTANGPEQCDDRDLDGASCATFGFYAGSLTCANNCSYDTSRCAESCGDGAVNGSESCDGARPVNASCIDYGYDAGPLRCSDFCTPGFDSCALFGSRNQPTTPFPTDIWDVWAHDPGTAYAVASFDGVGYGDIRHWDGARWRQVYLDVSNELVGVWGLNENNVWASGDDGTILYFDGTSWTVSRQNASNGFIRDGWAATTNNVFALFGSSILRFNGSTWIQQSTPTSTTLWDIEGTSASNVYAVGADRTVLRYNGTSWSQIAPPSSVSSTVDFRALWLNGSQLWVGGDNGVVARYNGGTSWSVFTTPSTTTADTIYGLWGTASNNVYASVRNGRVWRYDGYGWGEIETGQTSNLLAIDGLDSGEYWTTSNSAEILYFTGTGFGVVPDPALDPSLTRLTSAWAAPNVARIYVAGRQFYAQRFNLRNWSVISPASGDFDDDIINDMWGPSSSIVYGAADSGRVMRTTGGSWTTFATLSAGWNLETLWGSASNNVFVYGYNSSQSDPFKGAMWQYNGSTWPFRQYMGADFIHDIHGVGTTYFAVGANGHIWQFDGTSVSNSWVTMQAGLDITLRGVWGASNNQFFAVGFTAEQFEAVILEWNGTDWTRLDLDPYPSLTAIDGRSSSDIFAVGGQGTVLHYDGAEWSPVDAETDANFTDVAYGYRNRVVIVGDQGVVEINRNGSSW